MKKLAINGGEPVRKELFPNQANIGPEEIAAAQRVLESQMLSGYRGNYQKYKGGKEVQAFEEAWSEKFFHPFAVAVNSCTSALQIACGAIGLQPGDEVIVTPYSMTCSATAPMLWGAKPVFVDVEPDYFCLDPESVKRHITEKTKAIIAVDLFGQPFSPKLRQIAKEYKLWLIEDAAQAPGAGMQIIPDSIYTGDLGHIGCFSFTQGKHITCGEGGMITTADPELALRCRLLINHAESVINDAPHFASNLHKHWKLAGFNLRMTEIQAAIAKEQLKKLDFSIGKRRENAAYLAEKLSGIECIRPGETRRSCDHVYYVQPFLYDDKNGIHRDRFIEAVKAELQPMRGREDEGVRIGCGYIKPLYRMPLFRERFDKNWPGRSEDGDFRPSEITPFRNVENLWSRELFLHLYLAPPTCRKDLDDISDAFHKVQANLEELR
jgi:perosamine synthetase